MGSMKNEYEVRGDVTVIFLKRRNGRILETFIDTEDLEKVSEYKGTWCAKPRRDKHTFYVMNHKGEYLHRLIMDAPENLVVDHIFHNTLDNRKRKLRVVTNAKNLLNQPKSMFSNFDMGSISWHKRDKKWRVQVYENKKRKWLGHYNTHKEAEDVLERYINKSAQ